MPLKQKGPSQEVGIHCWGIGWLDYNQTPVTKKEKRSNRVSLCNSMRDRVSLTHMRHCIVI